VERKDVESTKTVVVQVDTLLTFRQFSKKSADDSIDVSLADLGDLGYYFDRNIVQYEEVVGRATGSAEIRENPISSLSRISQLTGEHRVESPCVARSNETFEGFSELISAWIWYYAR
jgi:coatomer subunit beta